MFPQEEAQLVVLDGHFLSTVYMSLDSVDEPSMRKGASEKPMHTIIPTNELPRLPSERIPQDNPKAPHCGK